MSDTTVLTGIWIVAVVQVILEAGIVLNAYRLTKLTGSFRAWTLIIFAFLLTTASSVFGVIYILVSPDQITTLLQSLSLPSLILSYSISIATSVLLFFGILDLLRRFKHAAGNPNQ